MSDQEYVSAVNSVISICKDAQQGFDGAAKAVNSPSLKSVFEQYSTQRAGFIRELQELLRDSGEHAADPAGVAGTLHSGWMALKGVLTGHSEHQILIETERGEDLSLKTYRDALSKNIPVQVRAVLERQLQLVQEAHNWIRDLRDKAGQTAKQV